MKTATRIGFAILASAVLMLPFGVMANEEGLDKRKEAMIKEMDERIANLQSTRSCIAAAKDRSGMNGCFKNLRETRMKERSEMLEKRKEHIEERMQNLQKERSKIESNP